MPAESEELIQALSRIDTPTLSNAVEQLKVRNGISGFADLNLRCMNPQLGIMCGFAVTAQALTMAPQPGNRELAVSRLIEIWMKFPAWAFTSSPGDWSQAMPILKSYG